MRHAINFREHLDIRHYGVDGRGRRAADPRAVTAACLNAGGLWQIYSTPLVGWMQSGSLVQVAVHAHLLLAGYLRTTAAIGLDSTPHRAPHLITAVAPLATMASHSILAKTLFDTPLTPLPR
ncbi:cytochrome c oxidase assembly protein [Agrococcus sp. Ld7]|uniref:cytochrome c oxidase assembly protein n=1 Tax=Agrococcus sp. Ld7 TaxID=649148 RepID=UPI00386CDDA5